MLKHYEKDMLRKQMRTYYRGSLNVPSNKDNWERFIHPGYIARQLVNHSKHSYEEIYEYAKELKQIKQLEDLLDEAP